MIEKFDNLHIEEELSLSKGLNCLNFKTKSFEKLNHFYTIGKDNCFYKQIKKDSKKTKIDFHGLISFYSFTQCVDYDIVSEYVAKFTDGLLQDIKLIREQTFFHNKQSKPKSICKLKFCFPKFVFGFKRKEKETEFGLFASEIDTGFCYKQNNLIKEICFKILGVGFILISKDET